MESMEALRLRERAAFMRRVANVRVRGDAEVNRELLALVEVRPRSNARQQGVMAA